MVYSARTMALLLAVSIALVTALFLSLVDGVDRQALIVAVVISFSASYLLTLSFSFFVRSIRFIK
jgi:predicted outer membrane lipoprotein